jgi:hypothetical protein
MMRAKRAICSSAKNADDSRGTLRSFAAKQPAAQDDIRVDDIKLKTLGEKKLWQSKSFMEKSRDRRFFAA